MSHPVVNMIFVHTSIREELFDNFQVHNSTRIQQFSPCSLFEHIRYASVLKGIQFDNPFHNFCGSFVAIMSASANMKLLEFVWGHLEDLLEVECLVGDIYTRKKKSAKTQKQSTNLIRFKLFQNICINT